MSDVFGKIAIERRALADMLAGLDDEQWKVPSLCSGWTVREVAAHLAMPFSLSLPKMMVKIVQKRGDFNRMADDWAKAEQRSNAELVELLRANAENRFKPPGFGPEAPLSDVVIHGQDIRRPLGLPTEVDADHASVVLDLLVSKQATKGFVDKGRFDGLELQATDTGWSYGQGAAVHGPAAALLSAMAGRRAVLAELSGDGVALLDARLKG
jgi:uncharacterized protein (TIGR03083 family)